MNNDDIYQIILVIIGISYKYLLAKEKLWGWILSSTSSLISAFYVYLYYNSSIIMSLEICFMSLSIYGIYKHRVRKDELTKVDISIIALTFIAIIFLVLGQLKSNTVWYEIGASIAFLSGVVLLAQKNFIFKIIAWFNFTMGSVFIGSYLFQKGSYILLLLHVVSLIIGIFTIRKNIINLKKERKNNEQRKEIQIR